MGTQAMTPITPGDTVEHSKTHRIATVVEFDEHGWVRLAANDDLWWEPQPEHWRRVCLK